MGERTPHLDAAARGAWIGLTAKHQRADLTRAILEGVCYSQRDCLEIIRELGAPVSKVRLSGGGAKSPFWHQMFADIFGTSVVTLASQEGSAYGAALLALIGTGQYVSAKEVCAAAIEENAIRQPCPDPSITTSAPTRFTAPSILPCSRLTNRSALSMSDQGFRYCDVSVPVPLDRAFTYELPSTLRHRAQRGCRLLVPFGNRRLVSVILSVHNDDPPPGTREAIQLIDEEPVLSKELLRLGAWIAEYYCAPLGEVLRGMLPLGGEVRRRKIFSLTDAGRDAARQLLVSEAADAGSRVLQLLEHKPLTAEAIASKVEKGKQILQQLLKRGWVAVGEERADRDPLRSSAERLQVEFVQRPLTATKLKKPERELLAFLELHPGSHNLAELAETLKGASAAARALARRELVRLETERPRIGAGYERPAPQLNPSQQDAFDAVRAALDKGEFAAFLLEGVTGSGKTEVYMSSIEAVLALGRNALLLVPEIALTPAMAGQFFHRFGDQVAILHSAFSESERAEQWRRIRRGEARVIVGTRSGIFAPVQNLGLVIVDEEHDTSYKQQEAPRYHGRDVALLRAREAGAVAVLGSATPSVESRFNAESGKYTRLHMAQRVGNRPLPQVEIIDMRLEFLETKKQATFSRKLLEEMGQRLSSGEQVMLLLNRRGFSSFMVCRACGERLQCVDCAVSLTYHRRDRRMLCHYCGYAEPVPEECPKCGSDHIQFLGAGSERIEDELHQHFPPLASRG